MASPFRPVRMPVASGVRPGFRRSPCGWMEPWNGRNEMRGAVSPPAFGFSAITCSLSGPADRLAVAARWRAPAIGRWSSPRPGTARASSPGSSPRREFRPSTCTATCRKAPAPGTWPRFPVTRSASWSRPTSPPAASTSTASAWSSTRIRRRAQGLRAPGRAHRPRGRRGPCDHPADPAQGSEVRRLMRRAGVVPVAPAAGPHSPVLRSIAGPPAERVTPAPRRRGERRLPAVGNATGPGAAAVSARSGGHRGHGRR